ncbi:RNA polymerase sigma factor [Amnibacterium kyonggiense]|uniref:RNA polymerase sigma-70 factor (ECF subfamily) n=1 Tax=Amnibacterium kyonggiense TaxID=595671 RepID=A0A4R7FKM4_9MICO|nr:sigma-70 family RNA polymerase sigma factor [Amnibacterium kyonggiense]TDS76898.1 RNA polymerase sigma-70 factor (ECF subfamily) [Amnibacterium kyonggiense]
MSLEILDTATDLDLVLRARAGDGRAFAQLLRRHGAAMRAVALRTTRNGADADDAVQEAAVHVWRNLASLRDPEKARSWMLRIAAREAVRRVVGARQEHELDDDAASVAGPDLAVDRFDLHAGLRSGLRALPEPQARAWLLREAHGLSYREIAERLDASESTVRGWLVLARKRIQRSIDECCPTARPRAVSVRLPVGGDVPPVVEAEPAPVATAPGLTPRATGRG